MRISDWSSDVCSSDLLIATCGDSSWRRAQRKRVGLLVEARAAVQCKAGDTPEPAPQLVEPRFGVLKAQFEAVENVLIEVLQQLGLSVFDAVGDNFFQLGLQGVEGGRSEEHTSELQSLM